MGGACRDWPATPSTRAPCGPSATPYLAQAYLYRVDVTDEPATITERIAVGGVDVADQRLGDYDLEGVAVRPEGGFWLASEGRTNVGSSRPNLIVRTDAAGAVLDAVELPAGAGRRRHQQRLRGRRRDRHARPAATRSCGWPCSGSGPTTRPAWSSSAATTSPRPRGRSPTTRSTPVQSPAGGFVGLSELTLLPDGTLAVIERDNQLGQDARIKRIYRVDPPR